MPQVTGAVILQFVVLLCALPMQYLITEWTSGTAAQRHLATQGIIEAWEGVRQSFLDVSVWTRWFSSWIPKLEFLGEVDDLDEVHKEMVALEMLMNSNDQGYFAASKEPRRPRPGYVLHRVGEVIMETQNNMVGVIVGWDEGLRAPPEWIRRKKYTESEVRRMEDTPHYKVLFSGPDSSSILIGYLPQNVIKLFEGFRPDIPTLDLYFSHFDGRRFVMHDWLQEIYPDDTERIIPIIPEKP